jgi:hypothetical protein
MPFYVFALLDAAPAKAGRGLSGALTIREVAGAFAAVERRADVPPLDFGTLRAHEAIVDRLAALVPAILPVRFGTLLAADDLLADLEDRSDDLQEAFDLVRGRVQFTWRSAGPGRAARPPARARAAARSGADYLRRAARGAHPAPPPAFRRARGLTKLTAAERFVHEGQTLPEALYHLVDRTRAEAYASAANAVRAHAPGLTWSGPFAPYAFAPELL